MNFEDPAEFSDIERAIDQLCAKYPDEYWLACDEGKRFPSEFYGDMAANGWLGVAIPEAYGGAGRGITEAALVLNRVAASGAAMNGSTAVHLTIFGLNPVVKFGSEFLRNAFLPRAAAGDLHVAFGVTEADAGSDLSAISTRATLQDDGTWRVAGKKVWTSKAMEAEVVLLLVRTDPPTARKFDGLSLFLADLDPRYVERRPIAKAGRNAIASCEVFYDGLPVSSDRLIGERGRGFEYLLHGLNPERILLAAMSCGIGEVALKRAVSYAKGRHVFGRPIGSNQAISHPLAQSHMELQAAYLMMRRAAWLYDDGQQCAEEANSAKYLAAAACYRAADQAVQTHGGFGYASEYHVERYWREARIQRLAPVTQEMTCNYVAQTVLGLPRSY